MINMVKVLVLDDGYHDKDVIILTKEGSLAKVSLVDFINIILCFPHRTEYQIKTAHYEDIISACFIASFAKLNHITYLDVSHDKDLIEDFKKLYDSDEVVEGCDIH